MSGLLLLSVVGASLSKVALDHRHMEVQPDGSMWSFRGTDDHEEQPSLVEAKRVTVDSLGKVSEDPKTAPKAPEAPKAPNKGHAPSKPPDDDAPPSAEGPDPNDHAPDPKDEPKAGKDGKDGPKDGETAPGQKDDSKAGEKDDSKATTTKDQVKDTPEAGSPPPGAYAGVEMSMDKYITLHSVCVMFSVMLTMAIAFEIGHYFIIKEEYSTGAPLESEKFSGTWADPRNFDLAWEYMMSPVGRAKGLPLMLASLAIGGVGVYLAYVVNALVANFWDAMQNKESKAFFLALTTFLFISIVSLLGNAYRSYVDRILKIGAREFLTKRYTRLWLGNSAHFQPVNTAPEGTEGLMGKPLDNPDQRIADDCQSYISSTLGLVLDFASNMGMLCVFLPVLYNISPPSGPFGYTSFACTGWLCHFALVYSSVGTFIVQLLGSQIATLSYAKERSEADLRFALVTIRDHSEGVAFLAPASEETEHRIVQNLFNKLRGVCWRVYFLEKRLGLFSGGFWSIADIMPIFILAPAFFSGELTMGTMLQVRHALESVTGCFSWFVDAYFRLGEWAAVCHRLREVDEFGKRRTLQLEAQRREGGGLSADELTLLTPAGEALLDRASFVVPAGKWALLSGPEGSGKTTLLRALRGVGPPPAGGAVGLDKVGSMFIPAARSSGLRQGTLKDAACYGNQKAERDAYPDEAVKDALQAVGLQSLLQRRPEFRDDDDDDDELPGLNGRADWGRCLSAGEMQRLMLARAILVKPDVLVLDEPVAHCAEGQATHDLFKKLKQALPNTTVLTVTHQGKDVLREFHDLEISLDPKQKALHVQPVA